MSTAPATLSCAVAQASTPRNVSTRLRVHAESTPSPGGASALVHGHVGWPAQRRVAGGTREAVLALVRTQYGGAATKGSGQWFGPTLCAEHLWDEHGLLVPVSTLRGWMTAAGLWSQVRRARPVHVRRLRKAHCGEWCRADLSTRGGILIRVSEGTFSCALDVRKEFP